MDLSLLRLHNFWLPILWMIGAGIVLYKMPKTSVLVGGQVRERWYWVTSIMLVAPLIIWAGARNDYGDTYSYIRHFSRAPTYLEDLPVYLANNTKDQGFTILMALCKLMGVRTYSGFFMIIASVQILCMVYTFRRYSSDMWICFFLFVASTDYLSWMFNGIRQFLAVTLIFAGFDLKGNVFQNIIFSVRITEGQVTKFDITADIFQFCCTFLIQYIHFSIQQLSHTF